MLFVYIHGFNSSPESHKARCFGKFLNKYHPQHQYIVPRLSDLPERAIAALTGVIIGHDHQDIALLGSSLGGFYATWLAQKYQLRAALVNPAANPQALLIDFLGSNKNFYTGEEYELTEEHITQLDAISTSEILFPEHLMVLLQTGDEVLDYRQAEKKYARSHMFIEAGGDHSFDNFSHYCEKIYQFLSHSKIE